MMTESSDATIERKPNADQAALGLTVGEILGHNYRNKTRLFLQVRQ